ncbi:MAG: hypothetical protein PVJ78_07090 [Gammaproteobacteria bacterium]|jgi:hypothetical protein
MNRLLVALLPGLALVSSCATNVDIDADDRTQFTSLQTSFPLQDDLRLRLQATRVDGSFSQQLDYTEYIRLDDSSFSGPDEVEGDIELTYYSVAIGGNRAGGDSFRTETYYGISQTHFDLNLGNDTERLEASDESVEFYLQFATYAAISESADFGFRWALSLGRELSGISEIDLLLEYELAEHLQLTGGYRWFEYNYDPGNEDSNIVVDFNGPFLGIQVPF